MNWGVFGYSEKVSKNKFVEYVEPKEKKKSNSFELSFLRWFLSVGFVVGTTVGVIKMGWVGLIINPLGQVCLLLLLVVFAEEE